MQKEQIEQNSTPHFTKTRSAILSTSLLNEPFIALFALLPFILRKDLGASAFQISLLTMLKPMVAVFSFYWSARLSRKKGNLRFNLVGPGILSFIPFLFFPWVDSIAFLIASGAFYMLFSRAGIPAWIEILKRNLTKSWREKLFSFGLALGCTEGVIIGLFVGSLLDTNENTWKWLFFTSALLGLTGVFIQSQLPIKLDQEILIEKTPSSASPWKTSWELLRKNLKFAQWQWGIMAGGFGMMLIIPAQALFFVDILGLNHKEVTIGRCICFGLGFVLSSSVWSRAMSRFAMNKLTAIVCLGFALFPLLLLFSYFSLFWLYLAFVIYGLTQAGSNLIWNLSGPYFAGKQDSSQYSAVNVLMVGLRGCVAPLLGGFLSDLTSPWYVLILGMVISLSGSWYLYSKKPFTLKAET